MAVSGIEPLKILANHHLLLFYTTVLRFVTLLYSWSNPSINFYRVKLIKFPAGGDGVGVVG